jgi:hypothetical protein
MANPLHFEPDSENVLRSRLKEALAVPLKQLSYNAGQDRRHVFDHFDGLRVIVTRDDDDRVHLSMSIQRGGYLDTSPLITSPVILDIEVDKRLAAFGGKLLDKSNRINKFVSPSGILHAFYRYDVNLVPEA